MKTTAWYTNSKCAKYTLLSKTILTMQFYIFILKQENFTPKDIPDTVHGISKKSLVNMRIVNKK